MEVSNEFYSGFLVLYFMSAFIIWLGLFWWIFDFHIFNVIFNCIAWLFSIIFFIIIFVFVIYLFSLFFFFYQGFLSQTLTIHRTAGEVRGPSFIPLYHFHPLTNIETLICNFACEMNIIILNRNACVYQAATLWDLPTYGITIWLIEWWCNVCLFTW